MTDNQASPSTKKRKISATKVKLVKGTRQLARSRAIIALVLIGAVCAFSGYQYVVSQPTYTTTIYTISQSTISNLVNQTGVQFVRSSGSVPYYIVENNQSKPIGLVYLTTDIAKKASYGYSGPVGVLVYVNLNGTIQAMKIYSITDSFAMLVTQQWLNGFVGRNVFQSMEIGHGVTPVTGATFSSTGVTNGVRVAGRTVVDDYNHITPTGSSGSILGDLSTGLTSLNLEQEISLISLAALFAGAIISFEKKNDILRYAVWVGSIGIMGFYSATMVTISDLPKFLKLSFPPLSANIEWYVLYGAVIATTLIWGRLYCGYICPFGTLSEIINKVSPFKNLRIPMRIHNKLVNVKYFVLGVVIIGILLGVLLTQVEPFSTLFLLSGAIALWVFVVLMLGSSFFINRFYCRYICPAGAALSLLARLRVREIKRWPECANCQICTTQCCLQAITGSHISSTQCMNCRGCEEYYSNVNLCPHYASERIALHKAEQKTNHLTPN